MRRVIFILLTSCLLAAQQDPRLALRDDPIQRAKEERHFDLSKFSPDEQKAISDRVAFEHKKRTAALRVLPTAIGAESWRNLGPLINNALTGLQGGIWKDLVNDSGRIHSIVPHPTDPKIVYLSTAGGGVWKATNANPSSSAPWNWAPMTDDLPPILGRGTISTSLLAMSPDDPERLHLAMGDWSFSGTNAPNLTGAPLYVSRDGARTWEASSVPPNLYLRWISGLLALPGNVVLATAGNFSGDLMLRSVDGGRSFQTQSIPSGCKFLGSRIHLQLLSDRVVLLADGANVFRSTDAGLTWVRTATDEAMKDYPAILPPLTAQGRMTLAASASNPSVVYGIYRWQDAANSNNFAPGVLKSLDGGLSWAFLKAPANQQWNIAGAYNMQATYNHLLTVDPNNPDIVFCAGQVGLHRSMDGGKTWMQLTEIWPRPYLHPDNHAAAWSPGPNASLYLGHDGGLSVLLDPYRSSPPEGYVIPSYLNHAPSLGLANHLAYGLACTDADTPPDAKARILLFMQDNGVSQRLGDAVSRWSSSSFGSVCGGDGMAALIHPLDGNRGLASAQGNWIYWTADGFKTSFRSTGIPEWPQDGYHPFFTVLSQGGEPDGNTVYVIKSEAVYRSRDFGATFATIPPPPREGSYAHYSSVSASPFEVGTLIVVVAITQKPGDVYSTTRAFLTRNAGASWTDITPIKIGLDPYSRFHFDPHNPNLLYASSPNAYRDQSTNVYRTLIKSLDGGLSWAGIDGYPVLGDPRDNGFPNSLPCHDLKVDPTDSRKLLAATEIGVYRSLDGGASWQPYGQGMPMVRVTGLFIAKDGKYARAATFGRGVWEIGTTPAPPPPTLAISPRPSFLWEGEAVTFTPQVTGITDTTTVWIVTNGGVDSTSKGATLRVAPLPGTMTVKGVSAVSSVAMDQVITEVRGLDQDRDGKVTVLDMAFLSLAYGHKATDPDWNLYRLADLNADGKVDDADVDLLIPSLK